MRKTFKYILVVLAVILTVGSLALFTVRRQVLDPAVYTDALARSGIYEEITAIAEDRLTQELIAVGKSAVAELGIAEQEEDVISNILVWLLNTVIDSQTGTLVKYISDAVGFDQLVQQASETAIRYSLEWLGGERPTPEFLKYIPTKAELEAARDINVADLIALVTRRALRIENLPACANRDELIQNLELVRDRRFMQLTCTTPELDPIINQSIVDLIPPEIVTTIEGTVQTYIDRANLQPIIDQAFAVAITIAEKKEALETLREYVIASRQVAIWMLVGSILAMIGALILAEKRRVRLFAIIYFASGLAILVKAAFGYGILPYIVIRSVSFDSLIAWGALSPAQSALLIESIKILVVSIIQNLFIAALYLGAIMTAAAALIWVGDFLARYYNLYKKAGAYFRNWRRAKKSKKSPKNKRKSKKKK